MTTYKDAGVDIDAKAEASRMAYAHAASTFASRKGMVGEPVYEKDGYGGFLDFGNDYLVVSDDSTGSKIDLAFDVGTFDTIGYDLAAMVADDAVCTGAEPLCITSTLDVPKIDPAVIDGLMSGLAKACTEQKIAVPAGEIADVPGAVTRGVWSATVVGIVAKDRVIDTKTVEEGDVILALQDAVARSNGFSLIRKVLSDVLGNDWTKKDWKNGTTWGEIMLSPSIIYTSAILSLVGRHGAERLVPVKGIAHVTGGGIPNKLGRVLKATGLGAKLTDLWAPHEALQEVIRLGSVPVDEAYRTWHMGNGMLVIVSKKDAPAALKLLKAAKINAKIAGTVVKKPDIVISSYTGETLIFPPKEPVH